MSATHEKRKRKRVHSPTKLKAEQVGAAGNDGGSKQPRSVETTVTTPNVQKIKPKIDRDETDLHSIATPSSETNEAENNGRRHLPDVKDVHDVVARFKRAKRAVVLAGAGISVSCGIPDFRSPDGLYVTLADLDLPVAEPEDLFDIHTFDDSPEIFYRFANRIWPNDSIKPSATHRFLKALSDSKKLLRVYTQNIDGLEQACGIAKTKIVECHGTVRTSRCRKCKKVANSSELSEIVMQGQVPFCLRCKTGVMKPDVTFFGESIPAKIFEKMDKDKEKADLLVIIGTSLAVAPITRLLDILPHHIPQVLINREIVTPPKSYKSEGFDVTLLGECDETITYIAREIGLKLSASADTHSQPKQQQQQQHHHQQQQQQQQQQQHHRQQQEQQQEQQHQQHHHQQQQQQQQQQQKQQHQQQQQQQHQQQQQQQQHQQRSTSNITTTVSTYNESNSNTHHNSYSNTHNDSNSNTYNNSNSSNNDTHNKKAWKLDKHGTPRIFRFVFKKKIDLFF